MWIIDVCRVETLSAKLSVFDWVAFHMLSSSVVLPEVPPDLLSGITSLMWCDFDQKKLNSFQLSCNILTDSGLVHLKSTNAPFTLVPDSLDIFTKYSTIIYLNKSEVLAQYSKQFMRNCCFTTRVCMHGRCRILLPLRMLYFTFN